MPKTIFDIDAELKSIKRYKYFSMFNGEKYERENPIPSKFSLQFEVNADGENFFTIMMIILRENEETFFLQ
jgi:hypothetical protein